MTVKSIIMKREELSFKHEEKDKQREASNIKGNHTIQNKQSITKHLEDENLGSTKLNSTHVPS